MTRGKKGTLAKLLAAALVFQMTAGVSLPVQGVTAASYDLNATASSDQLKENPGVYYVKASPGRQQQTVGIPSVAKLEAPTKEMPAIIMGAAVTNEIKTGPVNYKEFGGGRTAPYSYFHYGIMDEQYKEADGSITTHKKLSGFDGSYYIVRFDISEIIKDHVDKGEYLHVKQTDNKALMVASGMNDAGTAYTYVSTAAETNGSCIQTGTYSLGGTNKAGEAIESYDRSYARSHVSSARQTGLVVEGGSTYYDVAVLSSGMLAAGADAGKAGAPSADIKLSFYVDGTGTYNNLTALDPNSMPTFPYSADGMTFQTEADYNSALSAKFYDETKAINAVSPTSVSAKEDLAGYASFLIKGSDLQVDVAIDKSEGPKMIPEGQGIKWINEDDDFWSMNKAIAHQAYNNHTIRLICEVPVLEGLEISSSGGARSVIIDVNSFDIQIANNTQKQSAGLTIGGNSQLRLMDSSNTSGAELAIGNNATMVIKKGGVMIIDESCTNEVEYDAATTADPTKIDTQTLNGSITVMDGGELRNYGVVNIEGTEAKPNTASAAEQQAGQQVYTDKKSADLEVQYGGLLNNYGCVSLKGVLYAMGTVNNYGKYNNTIVAHDPDKGSTSYHRGIQLTWKDDVTQSGVEPGILNIGIDRDKNIEKRALVDNYGDIVVVPGTINLYGTFRNSGNDAHIYMCDADEAIIPITPSQQDPLTVEKRVTLNPPKKSVFNNYGTLSAVLERAKVALLHNGVLGDLTPLGLWPDNPSSSSSSSSTGSTSTYVPSSSSSSSGGGSSSSEKVSSYGKGSSRAAYQKTGKNSVTYVAPSLKRNAKNVVIPAKIKIGKKTYKVTKIDAYAFTGYDKLKTITIGANIIKISPNAFYGCNSLTSLKLLTKKLNKKGVKGSLSGSKIRLIQLQKAARKKLSAYRRFFTKKNTGAPKKIVVQQQKK